VGGVYETFEAKPASRVPMEVAAQHLVGSLMRFLAWWLDNDRPYPPERMGEVYQDLLLGLLEETAVRRRGVEEGKGSRGRQKVASHLTRASQPGRPGH